MNKAKLRRLANVVGLALAIAAILAGLLIFNEWGRVLINARLL